MFKIVVEGTNLRELHDNLSKINKQLSHYNENNVSEVKPVYGESPVVQTLNAVRDINNIAEENFTQNVEDKPKTGIPKATRKRKAKEETEDVAAPAIKIPPVPTTATPVHSNMSKTATHVNVSPVAPPPPTMVPELFQVKSYTQQSFTSELFAVVNYLLQHKKIDNGWIAEANEVYGTTGIHEWQANQEVMSNLFDTFISWGLVARIGA